MGSGEMESVSELSRVRSASKPLEEGHRERASSIRSVTSFGGISEETVAFRRFGFTMGDCRTREVPLVRGMARLLVFLNGLLPCSCATMAGSPSRSMSTSMGEWPVELPEVVFCDGWWACWWVCAFRAGEVRGLK